MEKYISIGAFDLIGGFIAMIGFIVAISKYFWDQLNSKQQIVRTALSQLEVTKSWASAGNDGYCNEPNDAEMLHRTDPSYLIFEVENSALREIQINPGIISFEDDFLYMLSSYNQILLSIAGLQQFRNNIAVSDMQAMKLISEQIEKEKKNNDVSFKRFKKQLLLQENGDYLVYLAENLYDLNYKIHYRLISSKNKSNHCLHLFHIELTNKLKKEGCNIQKQKWKVIGFAISFTLLMTVLGIFLLSLNQGPQLI